MDPATSAGWQCGGVYWFYLEFVDLSHNSLSVIGVRTASCDDKFGKHQFGFDQTKFITKWEIKESE